MSTYLYPKQHYLDLYDLHTIEECLEWYTNMYMRMEKGSKRLTKNNPDVDFDKETNKVCSYIVNVIKIERFRHKAETVNGWMERDKSLQEKYDETLPPDINCSKCGSKTQSTYKNMHDSYGENPKISFIFECPKCQHREIFYEDGSAWNFQRDLCKKCHVELKTKYIDDKKKNILTTITFCPNCDFEETEVTDFAKSERETQARKKYEQNLLAENREDFCLTDEAGPKAVMSLDRIVAFSKKMKEEDAKKKDPIFQKAQKLKILKLVDLKKLLTEKIKQQNFSDLQFGKPEVGRYIIIDFTVMDEKANRAEYDSKKELRLVINKTLDKTNWRLMSEGLSYRLGVLTGRLKAYENEEDLYQLANIHSKKK